MSQANAVIVGIDEAGRGSIAGPVVAAACVLIEDLVDNPLINDSKQISPEQRAVAFEWICQHCTYGVGIVDAQTVDEAGILEATEKAMQRAVAEVELAITPTYLLVDGRDKFWFNYPHSSIIKGDETEPCIAAASIVAKVTRDQLMIGYADEYPLYGFAQHKGYGTEAHFAAVSAHGPCSLHRQTFLESALAKAA